MVTKRSGPILLPPDEPSDYQGSREDDPLIPLNPRTAERKLLWKLDGRILPITCALYLFACLDRSNLGNARLQGLPEDVLGGDPTGLLFDWLVAIFVPYVLCQVPWTILSKYHNPRIWIGCSAILWGLCSTSMSVANDFESLFFARTGLGVFEAAFASSVLLYLSFYYTKAEHGTRIASWFGFSAVAGAFGGLLAYGIQHAKISMANWRLLFVVEGVPTILLGVLCLLFLPGRPESTDFLTQAEHKLAIERMNRGTKGDIGAVIYQKHILAAFVDCRVYAAGVIRFALNCTIASLSAFLPTIIETMGHSPALSQLMTVPPYAISALILVVASYISDRIQSRGLIIASGCILGAIGYMILLIVAQVHIHIRYFATFCIATGAHVALSLVLAWFAHNLGSEACGGVTPVWRDQPNGQYPGVALIPPNGGPSLLRVEPSESDAISSDAVSCALMFMAVSLALALTMSYRWENARRDVAFGEPDHDALVDTSELADEAPGFRYLP